MAEDNLANVQEVLKSVSFAEGEVSFLLREYGDLFSDFDPRPFSRRSLSQDFLSEARRASLDKGEAFEVCFFVPKAQRSLEHEAVLKRRLREHFTKHFKEKENEMLTVKRKGWALILSGVFMMFLAILIYSDVFFVPLLLKNILIVLTEPAGWFLFWIGGEKLVYEQKSKNPDFVFHKKMMLAQFHFKGY